MKTNVTIKIEDLTLTIMKGDEIVYHSDVDDTFDEDDVYDIARLVANGDEDVFYKIVDDIPEILGWND